MSISCKIGNTALSQSTGATVWRLVRLRLTDRTAIFVSRHSDSLCPLDNGVSAFSSVIIFCIPNLRSRQQRFATRLTTSVTSSARHTGVSFVRSTDIAPTALPTCRSICSSRDGISLRACCRPGVKLREDSVLSPRTVCVRARERATSRENMW